MPPPLSFYIPPPLWPDPMPTDPTENWSGFSIGIHAWTLQTALRLRQAGWPCEWVDHLPETGIVFIHRNALRWLPRYIAPRPQRLLVCFQGDLAPHPNAQVQVVQNPSAADPSQHRYFMPHWPQPGLLPRDEGRGDRFETIAFLGHGANLAPELTQPEWPHMLASLGLQWQPVINRNRWDDHQSLDNRWHDYRAVDAVVAVRSFDADILRRNRYYRHKPPTKLYNAWLAGVPAILGPESAYRAVGSSPHNYLEATSLDQVHQALAQLQGNPALRQALVTQGQQQAQAISPEAISQRWQQFIQETLVPLYGQWCRRPRWQQHLSIGQQWTRYGVTQLQQRLSRVG